MALEFRPPTDLINAYMNRPNPGLQVVDAAQQAMQVYAQQKALEQQQAMKNQELQLASAKSAREGREQFYNYGDVASLPKADQAAIGQPAQGPSNYLPPQDIPYQDQQGLALGGAQGPVQPTGALVPPQVPSMIQRYNDFLAKNPHGLKGNTMTEDMLYIKDPATGALTPSGTSQRPVKGRTIISGPSGGGTTDQKRTFQLKGFEGNVPVSYDTRTGDLVRGSPTNVPLSPTVAPSIPGAEVSKFGDLENLKEKMKTLRANYKPEFVGMVDAPIQAMKQKTGIGASGEAAFFKQTVQDLKDSLLRARSGAQINEQEYKRLLPLIPNETMSEVDFLAKADRFDQVLDEMVASKQGAFQAAGYRTPDFGGAPPPAVGGLDPAKKSRLEELRAKRAAGMLR